MPQQKLTPGYVVGITPGDELWSLTCVNRRIGTSSGVPTKIDAIVRYILLKMEKRSDEVTKKRAEISKAINYTTNCR